MSLTVHFITKNCETSCILETRSFPEHYTGANIARKLKDMVSTFNIDNSKVVAFVHDQDSTVKLAGEIIQRDASWYSINCAAKNVFIVLYIRPMTMNYSFKMKLFLKNYRFTSLPFFLIF